MPEECAELRPAIALEDVVAEEFAGRFVGEEVFHAPDVCVICSYGIRVGCI